MASHTKEQLAEIIEKHGKWLRDEDGGERANLSFADLRFANLSFANLSSANLSFADLRFANLGSANLSFADLSSANLSAADLSAANLSFANLSSADLSAANGNAAQIKTIHLETYPIAYTAEYLQIGCERHPIADWWVFDGARIAKMDGEKAVDFWNKWKTTLKQIIEMSPAIPTGHEAKQEAE